MNLQSPIYTEKRECQDCYKCVRNCPVKAIKVENNCATVIPESCIWCGRCVAVCPNGAKRVRDDLPRAMQLIGMGRQVIASVAPSWASELPDIEARSLVAGLKRLGFWAVSETALGAQEVSAHAAKLLQESRGRPILSSACPAAVNLLLRHDPLHAPLLTGLCSPVLAHARILRSLYGDSIAVVFFGPCIAKKWEADQSDGVLDIALTFEDLRKWLEQKAVDLSACEVGEDDRFVPAPAEEGSLYAVEGGMIAGMKRDGSVASAEYVSLSGIDHIERGMVGLETLTGGQGVFVELLACEGGCIGGPKTSRDAGLVVKRQRIVARARPATAEYPRAPERPIGAELIARPIVRRDLSETLIREALLAIGKRSADDELNCGGCGYETCREFARASLEGKAERSMCVTHMRKLAMKKANALFNKMPSAIVIVDRKLDVVEHNELFFRMFMGDEIPSARRTLEGLPLRRILRFAGLFQNVLRTGEDLLSREIRHRSKIVDGSIFTIEPHAVVGGIFEDVTRPAVHKEQIVKKARDVIQKNLATVQQIAYLLGENAAESETILDSIIESFSTPTEDEPKDDADDRGDEWKRPYRR